MKDRCDCETAEESRLCPGHARQLYERIMERCVALALDDTAGVDARRGARRVAAAARDALGR